MKELRHFIDLHLLEPSVIRHILKVAKEEKSKLIRQQSSERKLKGQHLAMIFEKPSTRTRVSFEVGINQLGGHAVCLDTHSSQLGRGETIEDTAKVLSRYVNLIMIRCFEHYKLLALAKAASVPVINGLSNHSHPCQVMADILTFEEKKGSIEGRRIAWIGDANNMLTSWVHAAVQLRFQVAVACPPKYPVSSQLQEWVQQSSYPEALMIHHTAEEAATLADAIVTDTWISMGDPEMEEKLNHFAGYQVNRQLFEKASPNAIFMHCLPAHRGEEVSEEVIDGPQSVIWDEVENRLHVQKAIMLWCKGVV